MISVTNNLTRFFEKETGRIIIYGAGNAGYWTGYYMARCNIEYSFYIDASIDREDALFNGKHVFFPEKLKEFVGEHFRIIVATGVYKEILGDLLWLDNKFSVDALCLVPQFTDFISGDLTFDINNFLGYFRRKLFNGDTPTILSNICTAGFIYKMMNMPMLSPTINIGIESEDFIKLCKDPKKYLSEDIIIEGWERDHGNPRLPKDMMVGRVLDISVYFTHISKDEDVSSRWNVMRKNVNWDNLIYVMAEHQRLEPISFNSIKKFNELEGKKLFIGVHNMVPGENCIYMKEQYLSRRDIAIENYFDLLGWLNNL